MFHAYERLRQTSIKDNTMGATILQRQRVVFIHIGKTAGLSVRNFFNQTVRARKANFLALGGGCSVLSTADLSHEVFKDNKAALDDFDLIAGHVPFSIAQRYLSPAQFVTTLRDPRWQLISNYCSQQPNKEKADFGLGDFIPLTEANPYAEWAIDNLQTRMLCNDFKFMQPVTSAMLEDAKCNLSCYFSLVGFCDELDAFLRLLAAQFGMPFDEAPRSNSTGAYKEHVTQEHLDFAGRRNAKDIELYAWARDVLAPRRQRRAASLGRKLVIDPPSTATLTGSAPTALPTYVRQRRARAVLGMKEVLGWGPVGRWLRQQPLAVSLWQRARQTSQSQSAIHSAASTKSLIRSVLAPKR